MKNIFSNRSGVPLIGIPSITATNQAYVKESLPHTLTAIEADGKDIKFIIKVVDAERGRTLMTHLFNPNEMHDHADEISTKLVKDVQQLLANEDIEAKVERKKADFSDVNFVTVTVSINLAERARTALSALDPQVQKALDDYRENFVGGFTAKNAKQSHTPRGMG